MVQSRIDEELTTEISSIGTQCHVFRCPSKSSIKKMKHLLLTGVCKTHENVSVWKINTFNTKTTHMISYHYYKWFEMGIIYLFYQKLQQKQFILTFKPSGSDYLFTFNALEQRMFKWPIQAKHIYIYIYIYKTENCINVCVWLKN